MHDFNIGYSQMRYHGTEVCVLREAERRMALGLATAPQMKAMYLMGVDDVHKRTFKEASFIIDGGDPDSYKGLKYTFIDEGKEVYAYSRKEADTIFKQLKAKNSKVKVKFEEI